MKCNLLEEEQVELSVTEHGFQFEMIPYEIKTFKLEIKGERIKEEIVR